jgi:hypothetical protein
MSTPPFDGFTAFALTTTAAGFNRRALTFQHQLEHVENMPLEVRNDFLGMLHLSTAFVAVSKGDADFLIAPARYVGYGDELTPDAFSRQRRGRAIEGNRVEGVLKKIGRLVDQNHPAWSALQTLCARFGCAPKSNARLWVVEMPVERTEDVLLRRLADMVHAVIPLLTAPQKAALAAVLRGDDLGTAAA